MTKPADLTEVQDLLGLVNVFVPRRDIGAWTEAQRETAEKWATNLYLRASDNTVRVPDRPTFLPAESSSIPGWWFNQGEPT